MYVGLTVLLWFHHDVRNTLFVCWWYKLCEWIVFAWNRVFLPTPLPVHAEPVLIPYPREIQIDYVVTVCEIQIDQRIKQNNPYGIALILVKEVICQLAGHENTTTTSKRPGSKRTKRQYKLYPKTKQKTNDARVSDRLLFRVKVIGSGTKLTCSKRTDSCCTGRMNTKEGRILE